MFPPHHNGPEQRHQGGADWLPFGVSSGEAAQESCVLWDGCPGLFVSILMS